MVPSYALEGQSAPLGHSVEPWHRGEPANRVDRVIDRRWPGKDDAMKTTASSPCLWNLRQFLPVLAILLTGSASRSAIADDWGAYAIVPASAPAFVLEAVGAGDA